VASRSRACTAHDRKGGRFVRVLCAAPDVDQGWRCAPRGFDDGGNAARGVFIFLAIVFAAGVVAGALGLVLGGAIGSAWERYHRGHRAPPGADSDVPDVTTARGGGHATRAQGSTGLELSPRFELSVEVGDYLCLMRLVSTEPLDVARTTTALAQTVNIAA
jgi:hypothetical protein